MQSRRDQVQAYSFVMGRLNSGVQRIDIDDIDQPVARTGRGTMGGLMVAALIGVLIALFGIIVPSGSDKSWESQGTLVIDTGTGARYLYVAGQLRPALNVTSAHLVAGTKLTIQTVSDADVSGVPVGAPFGIVDAPDAVPTAGELSTGAWSGCAVPGPNGNTSGLLVLHVGQAVRMTGLSATQGVVVAGSDGTDYLLWDGRRLRMASDRGVPQAMGYADVPPTHVSAAFLDAVPAGPDLTPPAIADTGDQGPALAGNPTRIGQLFADTAGRHYVLTTAGLVPLDATIFALLSGDPTTQQQAYGGGAVATPMVGPDDLARHPAPAGGAISVAAAAFPTSPPRAMDVRDQQAVCVALQPGQGAVSDHIGLATTAAALADAVTPDAGAGIRPACTQADLVAVRSGGGALVSAAPAGGGTGSTDYLVTDSGVKYPLPAASVLSLFGYNTSAQVILPATVVGLLPTGPSLDPTELVDGGVITPPKQAGCE